MAPHHTKVEARKASRIQLVRQDNRTALSHGRLSWFTQLTPKVPRAVSHYLSTEAYFGERRLLPETGLYCKASCPTAAGGGAASCDGEKSSKTRWRRLSFNRRAQAGIWSYGLKTAPFGLCLVCPLCLPVTCSHSSQSPGFGHEVDFPDRGRMRAQLRGSCRRLLVRNSPQGTSNR